MARLILASVCETNSQAQNSTEVLIKGTVTLNHGKTIFDQPSLTRSIDCRKYQVANELTYL
jgi:hypothetical protein